MNVEITGYTPDPVGHISRCAAVCYGKTDGKASRVRNCVRMGHMSVLEHASVSFLVDGCSRACSHQLVRHRMASYNQQSQRYVKREAEYVVPNTIRESPFNDEFKAFLDQANDLYRRMTDAGIPAEDARYVFPNAAMTVIVATMNWREIFHFLDLRTDRAAQWEIRELSQHLIEAVREIEDLKPMIELWQEHREVER